VISKLTTDICLLIRADKRDLKFEFINYICHKGLNYQLKNKKQYIAHLLLMLFCLSQGSYVVLNSVLQKHKSETFASIAHSKKCMTYTFTKTEWENVNFKDKHEVEINGNMFDIQSINELNNEVIVKGNFDTKEDQLISQQKQTKHDEQSAKKNVLSSINMICDEFPSYTFSNRDFIQQAYFQFDENVKDTSPQIDSPPPKV
jgi:hypothetical protein